MIRITSTALNVGQLAYRSVRSVVEQTYQDWTLDFFDAASTDDTRAQVSYASLEEVCHGRPQYGRIALHTESVRTGPLDKLIPLWRSFPDDDIVVWLDGDDELATPHALETVAQYHAAGAIVTYGSCLRSDGGVIRTGPVGPNPRTETTSGHWLLGHLKTFRAGAFKQIQDADLRDEDGEYYALSIDRAVMLPLVEMFPGRSLWVNRYLYIYHSEVSYDVKATPEQAAKAESTTRRIHGMPKYERNSWRP